MRKLLLATVFLGGAMLAGNSADAALIATSTVGGSPLGVAYENFNALPLGNGGGLLASGITVAFTPNAQAVTGSSGDLYAAPMLSGGNGANFAPFPGQPNGPDTTIYLAAGATNVSSGAKIVITFPTTEMYVGLLWGSVDAYNFLTFLDAVGNPIGTLTGADVLAFPNGNQGVGGTTYVNIDSTIAFKSIVATSTRETFEIDNLAFNRTTVPEPMTLSLLGAGLLGLGLIRRKRG